MKNFILMCLVLACSFTQAATITFTNPQGSKIEKSFSAAEFKKSLGELSRALLKEKGVDFAETTNKSNGQSSISKIWDYQSKTLILNADHGIAFGWCVALNGQLIKESADQLFFKYHSEHLDWFYGYTSIKAGKWDELCHPLE